MADTPHTLVGGVDTPASASGAQHHSHLHHTRNRIRHLLRADGRKVHIASSPVEADQLRKTLTTTNEKDDFDLVIHGSPEHVRTYVVKARIVRPS